MNNEKQRIAIAEACGWTVINGYLCHIKTNRNGAEEVATIAPLPDYLNDLNAMHEAEKILTALQRAPYAHELLRLVAINQPWCHLDFFQVAHATAEQRAEAFLRTIGKWEDEA